MCDAYDAMTSDRSYRRAMSSAAAMAELRRARRTQFDPVVVDSFAKVLAAAARATTQSARVTRRAAPVPG